MAVESQYLSMNPFNNHYPLPPLSGTTTESFLPTYGSVDNYVMGNGDSGLTYADQINLRKRRRESINPMVFWGEDLSLQMQQQQLEIDRLIAQHTEKVRMEIEERSNRFSRRIIAAIRENVTKRIKAKDNELEKIGKLNWALQEKAQTLSIEGQIWRDLAQTNEAEVQTLQTKLNQILTTQNFKYDDVASCCASNSREEEGEEVGSRGGERKEGRACRHCGEEESSVLLLPCRHLCLCRVCGSSVHTCPVCKTPKNVGVQVLM